MVSIDFIVGDILDVVIVEFSHGAGDTLDVLNLCMLSNTSSYLAHGG